jgi:hypothetical protein
MDYFSVFKVQMVDSISQNAFHKKIYLGTKFHILIFLLFFKIARKSLDLIIMSHSKGIIV